jgi:hypothetical protein
LEALLDSTAERAGAVDLVAAAAHPDAAEAACKLLAQSCEFWAADRVLFRRLIGLAAVDDEIEAAVGEREELRAAEWREVCRRLHNEHLLAADTKRVRRGAGTHPPQQLGRHRRTCR